MNILSHLGKIKYFIFDIDGVLTDGQLFVPESGELLRSMNIKDGYAMQLAIKKGYPIFIISGGQSSASERRLRNLGIEDIYIGVSDKAALLKTLSEQKKIMLPEAVYVGDDMPDIPAMKLCGLRACPKDACSDVQMMADYISPYDGGKGCVRDIIEKVLRINDHWS